MSINYLVRANSSTGLVNKIDSNITGAKKIYALDSESEYLKSEFLKLLGRHLEKGKECVQYFNSPFYSGFYDGLTNGIFAFADNDCIFDMAENEYKTINLNNVFVPSDFSTQTEDIKKSIDEKYNVIYNLYQKAKVIHDEWERVYISNMDMQRLNDFCNDTLNTIFKDIVPIKRHAQKYERFFGGAFYNGHVEYINSITNGIKKRYFIKGRPGSGKSTFLKKVVEKSLELGFDTEVYYCSFDVFSLDMVVIRDLSLCIFDSTSPHERFPENESDEILDFYVHSGLDGTDEKYERELYDIKFRYIQIMSIAKEYMADATSLYEKLNDVYKQNVNYDLLNNIVIGTLNNLG